MNVICFGDSNTYGHDPRSYLGGRYEEPWPEVLRKCSGWNVSNQGQNGRQIPKEQIPVPGDTDLLIVMLGTNDLLQGNSPDAVCSRMEQFLQKLEVERSKIILMAPPQMVFGSWVPEQRLIDGCLELAGEYGKLSQRLSVRFVDVSKWNLPLIFDGVHLSQEGHRTLGENLYAQLIG